VPSAAIPFSFPKGNQMKLSTIVLALTVAVSGVAAAAAGTSAGASAMERFKTANTAQETSLFELPQAPTDLYRYPTIASPVCGFCKWVVADIESTIVAAEKNALLEAQTYLEALCAANVPLGDDLLLQLCDNTVRSTIITALGVVSNQYLPHPSVVCQLVGLCRVPTCPTGFVATAGSPSLCVAPAAALSDVYTAVVKNCSTRALGSHLCSLDEAYGLSTVDFISFGDSLVPQVAAMTAAGRPPQVLWFQSIALFSTLGVNSFVSGPAPASLLGFRTGSDPLYQLGVDFETGNLDVVPWTVTGPTFAQHDLPYSGDETCPLVIGVGYCCAPRQQ